LESRVTEAKEPEKALESINDKFVLQRMELAGFKESTEEWIKSRIISDTAFRAFWHTEKKFYAFVGKIDDISDIKTYTEDLNILIFRIEKLIKILRESSNSSIIFLSGFHSFITSSDFTSPEIEPPESKEEMQERLSTVFIGFVTRSGVDINKSIKPAIMNLGDQERYRIAYNHDDEIRFGNVVVDFSRIA
jgi:hypothetical protein